MSLRQKTISGLVWSFLSQGGRQASQIVITAILARLLSPDDFGTLAMVTVFTNFAMIFSEMGVSSALIQKQDTHDRHYDSAFWLNILVGVGLTLIFMAASPIIAWFYKKPELNPILLVVAFNFLFSSFTIIQQTLLTKEMNFKSLAVRDITAVILAGIVGIAMAYHGFGIWSLVFQLLCATLINAVLLWFLSPWRPRLRFAVSDIKDIFHFSAHLTGFNVLNYFSRNIDQLLIGKFLGTQALGYYSLAYKIMLYPLQNISWVISRVMFPAFSKIQNDLEKVRTSYLKMVKAISLITFPLMAWLFGVAPEVVGVFLGEKWNPIVILIRIFCFCGMAQSIHTTCGGLLLSQGKSRLQLRLGLWSSILNTAAISIGLRWGIYGVAACYLIIQILWITYAQQICNMTIALDLDRFLQALKSTFIYSSFIALIAAGIASVSKFSAGMTFVIQLIVCTFFYFVLLRPTEKMKEIRV